MADAFITRRGGMGGATPFPNTCSAIFNVNGKNMGSITLPQGDSIQNNPYVPTSEGEYFTGWQSNGEDIRFPYVLNENTTFTAQMGSAKVYGVSGLGNSNPTLTRTYDNVGRTYSINSAAGTITTDFDTEFDFETVVQDGNIMIKIPKFYKRFDAITDNQVTAFSICKEKIDNSFQIYPCFLTEGGKEIDYILISKGKATGTSTKATCVQGNYPLVNVTRAQMRAAARANGTGWQQFDWMVLQLLRDLFCVVFATTNAQQIFLGRTTGFANAATVGGTWNISTPCGWNVSTMQNRFFGIEDIFGNVNDWCDGVAFDSSTIYTTTSPSLFSESTTNMIQSGTVPANNGYITKLSYINAQPFFNYASVATQGSNDTHYCDFTYNASSPDILFVGGYWNDTTSVGLWRLSGISTTTNNGFGGRLVYRPFI